APPRELARDLLAGCASYGQEAPRGLAESPGQGPRRGASMHVTKRAAVAALTAAAFAGSSITAVSALGDRGGDHGNGEHRRKGARRGPEDRAGCGQRRGSPLLESTLAPSVPTDHSIHGVTAGGVPWVLRFGEARLRSGGRIDAVIRGLVIPPPSGTGTAGP